MYVCTFYLHSSSVLSCPVQFIPPIFITSSSYVVPSISVLFAVQPCATILLFCFGTYSTKSQYKSASAQFFVDYAEIFIVFDDSRCRIFYLSSQTVFSLICCYPSFILVCVFFFFYSATHSELFIKCFSIEKLINASYMYEAFASSSTLFLSFLCI